MEEGLKAQNRFLARYIDHPIREIVPAIWDLPFIIDTGVTCSGHLLVQSSYPRQICLLPWEKPEPVHYKYHPAGAFLGLVFSDDPEMAEQCASFRYDLQSVLIKQGDIEFQFNRSMRYGQLTGDTHDYEYFETKRPPDEFTTRKVESLLASFWEEVANVIKTYNQSAQIGPIKGRNFRSANGLGRWDLIKLYEEAERLGKYKE